MPDEHPDSATPTKLFSDANVQAALARLKGKAAAQKATAATPPQPAPPEAVEMSAEELAANPEEARRRFEASVTDLRAAFAAWVAAKEEQFEQVLSLGWSGEHEDAASFLKHLEQERERLQLSAAQTDSDIDSTTGAMEVEEFHETLDAMKLEWASLRDQGVPRSQWPLASGLPWAIQFQAQAEIERAGNGESSA
ncbi:MAG: hypothetical protein MUF81_12420 [Verrucomicrobia bacterium]|jgi:hypothetical protein|nr:hypothetical protein [Verrucomicrobiota bacterium]